MRGALLLFGGGGDLGGRGIHLDAGALDLAHEIRKVVGQSVETIAEHAKLILPILLESFGKIAHAHPFEARNQSIERLPYG